MQHLIEASQLRGPISQQLRMLRAKVDLLVCERDEVCKPGRQDAVLEHTGEERGKKEKREECYKRERERERKKGEERKKERE